jgi:hypothetical protein
MVVLLVAALLLPLSGGIDTCEGENVAWGEIRAKGPGLSPIFERA